MFQFLIEWYKIMRTMNKDNKVDNTPTIKELRQKGYKIRVIRARFENKVLSKPIKDVEKNFNLYLQLEDDIHGTFRSCRGGLTTIQLRTPAGKEVEGKAKCSIKDQFNKKLGNSIALKRALENVEKI